MQVPKLKDKAKCFEGTPSVVDLVSVKFCNFKRKLLAYGLAISFHFLSTSQLHLSSTSQPGSMPPREKKAALSQNTLLPSAGRKMPY